MRGGRRIVAVALLVAVAAVGACSDDGPAPQERADGSSTSAPGSPATSSTAPRIAGRASDVGTTFQHQSFVITVGQAVYDADQQRLSLGLRFSNVSGRWAQTDTASVLELADGTTVPFAGDLVDVPPGATVDVTSVAVPIPEDPIADGIVTWGNAAFDQPSFRLDGDGGDNLWRPADVAADGWAQIGKFAVHLTGIQVNASHLDLGIQAPPGHRVLRAFVESFTTRGTTSPFQAASNLLLRLPSGLVVDAVHGSPAANQFSWTAQGGQWADFVVPADLDGAYELLLASMPKVGFGTIRPELVERRPIPFELANVSAGPPPDDTRLAMPGVFPSPAEGVGAAFDVPLDGGSMNIPGYDFHPTRLAYDPSTRSATLDATLTSLVSSVGPRDGLLSADPSFGFRVVLDTGNRLATGVLRGDATLDHDEPTDLTFEFSDVRELSADGAGIYVGPGEGAVSSMPLGESSDTVAWPPLPHAMLVDTPAVESGDWTVQLHARSASVCSIPTSARASDVASWSWPST